MQDRECIVFERTRDNESENPQAVCVFLSPVAHTVSNSSSGGSFPSDAISVAFARWNFLLHATKKNNNAAKFFGL